MSTLMFDLKFNYNKFLIQ